MIEETYELTMESRVDDAMDVEYEFDAPHFFDFSQPETDSEAEQAQSWFESASSDPPSPFIVKLNVGMDLDILSVSESCGNGSESTICTTSDCGPTVSYTLSTSEEDFGGSMSERTSKVKPTLSRCSTLMKPTASHLAKLSLTVPLRRTPKWPSKSYKKIAQRSLSGECPATKRQKVDAGLLHKVARAKHQLLLLHKVSKKTGSVNILSVRPKSKVTVPKEPVLVTAQRAQIRRSKINVDSPSHAVLNVHSSKAHPLNRKVLQSCLSLPKKTTAELSDFQVVQSSLFPCKRITAQPSDFQRFKVRNSTSSHLGTSESKRRNTVDAFKQERSRRASKLRLCCANMKELKSSSNKRPDYEPPVELFSKLSLGSKHYNSRSQEKLSSLPPKMTSVLKRKSERFGGKQLHCGSINRTPRVQAQTNTNRSLRIC